MSATIIQMPKPGAGQYLGERKLFLVPSFILPPGLPDDAEKILETYWSEVRDHLNGLERSLGKVSRIYHELVSDAGDDGMETLTQVNPRGGAFVKALCQSGAALESLEDRALLEESMDWQRCVSIGLVSEKVMTTALDAFRQASEGRSKHMLERIDNTLAPGESGALFIREDHGLQFPPDIRVFYVAPRSLDALKRWLEQQMRAPAPPPPADEDDAHNPVADLWTPS